jgi:hypothetical protein
MLSQIVVPSATLTAAMISPISTVPFPFTSHGVHVDTAALPSAMFTQVINSPMTTILSPLQSPAHCAFAGALDHIAAIKPKAPSQTNFFMDAPFLLPECESCPRWIE